MMSNWVFGMNHTKDMMYYFIMEHTHRKNLTIILDVQLPKKAPKWQGWSDLVQEAIQQDLDDFIKIFPKYMQDICDEHNGIKRMSEFPDYGIGHIEYTESAICIGGDGEGLQIAGGEPDKLGKSFMRNFVKGLQGNWEGIHF